MPLKQRPATATVAGDCVRRRPGPKRKHLIDKQTVPTVIRLAPDDSFQDHGRSRLARPQTVRIGRHSDATRFRCDVMMAAAAAPDTTTGRQQRLRRCAGHIRLMKENGDDVSGHLWLLRRDVH